MIEHVSPKIRREEWQIWQTQTTRYTRDESRGEKEDIPWLPRMCPNRRYSQTLLQKRRYSQTLPQKREDIPWLPKLCLNRRSQGPQKKIFPDYLGCAPIEDIPKLKEDIPWLPRPCPNRWYSQTLPSKKIIPGYLGRALCKFCFSQIALVPACGAIFTRLLDS